MKIRGLSLHILPLPHPHTVVKIRVNKVAKQVSQLTDQKGIKPKPGASASLTST